MNNEPSMDEAFLQKLTRIVEDNLANEQFGVEDLAREAGMSRSQLHRKLKKLAKKSGSQFIREIRLEHAMDMLQKDVATASEIAYRVGFGSPSYFSKSFHDYYGFPPGEAKEKDLSSLTSQEGSRKWYYLYAGIILILIVSTTLFLLPRPLSTIGNSGSNSEHKRATLAVVPFKHIGEENQVAFTNGMTEILNTNLAQVDRFRTISQNSIANYLRSYPLPKILLELDLDYLIEGSVQQIDERIRINIQLMDAKTNEYIWSNSYERYMGDALILQKVIAGDILQNVKNALGVDEDIELQVEASRVNPEALKLYLQAVGKQLERSYDGLFGSIDLLEKSVELDSTFSQSFARLSFAYSFAVLNAGPNKDFYNKKAQQLIDKALNINPNSSWAYLSQALLNEFNFEWDKAEESFNKAIVLNPSNDEAYHELAQHLMRLGKFEKAIESESRALYFSPHALAFQRGMGEIYFYKRDYKLAITELQKTLEMDSDHWITYLFLTKAYLFNNNFQKALESYERLSELVSVEISPNFAIEAQILTAMGQKVKALNLIEQNLNTYKRNRKYQIALAYIFLNDIDKALKYLKEAYQNHDFYMMYLKVDPALDPLRNDPRYQAIEKEVFGKYSSYSE